ncbi:MAG: radical SAM protein [Magnetococcales bacterium]|nr:radical SAM protein [Magnetococcales bacterium]MBF0151359.1 radical SAM protein [Magnetococcales bacterium]
MSRDPYRIDAHKLIYHPERAARVLAVNGDWERARSVYPIYMEIAPVGACNHRCVFCAVDYIGYQSVRLSYELLAQRVPEMGRLGVKSIMYAGEGEPLLHKDIARIVTMTKDAGIDVAITTNATVLPSGFIEQALARLSWLKVSINAGTAATYAALHQTKAADFDKAIENMIAMVRQKRASNLECTLGAQILLLQENQHEVETLAKLCRDEIGLDYLVVKPYSQHLFSKTQRYKEFDYQQFVSQGESLAHLNTEKFFIVFRGHTMQKLATTQRYHRCYATPFLWGFIMATGTVSGCSAFLLDQRFEYGNINDHTFQEIWEGEGRRRGFEFVMNQLDISECRVNCRMDEINRYLHQIDTRLVPHMNFI